MELLLFLDVVVLLLLLLYVVELLLHLLLVVLHVLEELCRAGTLRCFRFLLGRPLSAYFKAAPALCHLPLPPTQ